MTTDRGVEPMSPDERCDEIIRLIDEALRDQPPPHRQVTLPMGTTAENPPARSPHGALGRRGAA